MAHTEQIEFINTLSKHLPDYFRKVKVLEIGSLDINGSIRKYFSECEYTGIDVAQGPGVDLVCQGQDYNGPDESFDHVISCECMEHNPFWKETVLNMIRLSRPGGLVTMTCAAIGRDEHGTSRTEDEWSPLTVELGWSYYQNLSKDVLCRNIPFENFFEAHEIWTNWGRSDLYFAGIRKTDGATSINFDRWKEFKKDFDALVGSYNAPMRAKLRKCVGSVMGDFGLKLAKKFK